MKRLLVCRVVPASDEKVVNVGNQALEEHFRYARKNTACGELWIGVTVLVNATEDGSEKPCKDSRRFHRAVVEELKKIVYYPRKIDAGSTRTMKKAVRKKSH